MSRPDERAAETVSVADARDRYFAENDFGADGGYSRAWALGPVTLPIPNTAGRVQAVVRHDLHHVATGYATDLVGEAEIGAWEIASGCGSYAAAWILNLLAFSAGLVLPPRRVYRAFVRGRRSRNLYHEPGAAIEPAILAGSVAELRERLAIGPGRPAAGDPLCFVFWSLSAGALVLSPLLLGVCLLAD